MTTPTLATLTQAQVDQLDGKGLPSPMGPMATALGMGTLLQEIASRLGALETVDTATDTRLDSLELLEPLPTLKSRFYQDFNYKAGAAMILPYTVITPVGTPTGLAFVSNARGGQISLILATTNEAELTGVNWADNLTVDAFRGPIMEFRMSITPDVTGAGGLFAAGDILVAGLASAHNATADSIVTNAWFRFEGANLNITCETDDGTTDSDDQDTLVDYVSGTFLTLKIDMTTLSAVKFYVNGVLKKTLSMAAIVATGTGLQPYFALRKAAAANFDHKVLVDYVDITCTRG